MVIREPTSWEILLLGFAIGLIGNLAATALWDMASTGGETPKNLLTSAALIIFGIIIGLLSRLALISRKESSAPKVTPVKETI